MAQKILKLNPIPSDASADDIRHILKDFSIQQVSIRGDAAYVKFEQFGQSQIDILDFNFTNKTYNEKGWNATISVLPATDWDSSEEEVIEVEKKEEETVAQKVSEPEYEQAEEIKTSGVTEDKDTQAISVPEHLVNDAPEIVSWKAPEESPIKFESKTVPNQYPALDSVFVPKEVKEIVPEIVREIQRPKYVKAEETSSVLPSGLKSEVEEILYQAKQAAVNELNQLSNSSGQTIPAWIWPLAVVFTLLSLTMH